MIVLLVILFILVCIAAEAQGQNTPSNTTK
jgi:hypothetical protein